MRGRVKRRLQRLGFRPSACGTLPRPDGGWLRRSLPSLYLSLYRDETLHPLAIEHLTRIDVSFRMDGNHVESEDLPAVLSHAAERAHTFAVFAVEEPDVVVR